MLLVLIPSMISIPFLQCTQATYLVLKIRKMKSAADLDIELPKKTVMCEGSGRSTGKV